MNGFRSIILPGVAFLLLPTFPHLFPNGFCPNNIEHHAIGEPPLHDDGPPTYYLAPVHDMTLNDKQALDETDRLEALLQQKIRRVDSADKDFFHVRTCLRYPCEVVVEEVTKTDSFYIYQLQFRVIKEPGDNSPVDPCHKLASDSRHCPINAVMTKEYCDSLAPNWMARFLEDHDQQFHSGGRP